MILSPTSICPAVLDRQRSVTFATNKSKVWVAFWKTYVITNNLIAFQSRPTNSQQCISKSVQHKTTVHYWFLSIRNPVADKVIEYCENFSICWILVKYTIYPKGDRPKVIRVFIQHIFPCWQYAVSSVDELNSFRLCSGLTMFKDVPSFKVICCGGDGTVGWVLEAMGEHKYFLHNGVIIPSET